MGLFSFNVDGTGFDANSKGVKANLDGIGVDTNRTGIGVNVEGIGYAKGKQGVSAHIDGVGFNSKADKTKVGFRVDGIKVQVSLDNILTRSAIAKFKQLVQLAKNVNYASAYHKLHDIYKRVRTGGRNGRMTAGEVATYVMDGASNLSKSFMEFLRDWAKSGQNPLRYIINRFTMTEVERLVWEIKRDLKAHGNGELAKDRIIKQLIDARTKNPDNIDVDIDLGRVMRTPEQLLGAMEKFKDLYADRMRNLASDLVKDSKNWSASDNTKAKIHRINQFNDRMRSEIRKVTLGGHIFGAGGVQRLTGTHLKSMSVINTQMFEYLDGFMSNLYAMAEQGKEINPNATERASRYANVMRQAFYASYQEKAIDTYGSSGYERRILSPAESCADCIDYADAGCQPLGTLPLPTVGSACMNNCKCEYMVYDSKEICEQESEGHGTDGGDE